MKEHGEYNGLLTFVDKYPSTGYNIMKVVSLTLGLVIEIRYEFDHKFMVDKEEPDITIEQVNFNSCDRLGICSFKPNQDHFDRLESVQQNEVIKMFNNVFKGIHDITPEKVASAEAGDMFG